MVGLIGATFGALDLWEADKDAILLEILICDVRNYRIKVVIVGGLPAIDRDVDDTLGFVEFGCNRRKALVVAIQHPIAHGRD